MSDFQKQTVQWFPGHMAKTRRLIKKCLSQVDLVAEIVDARIPESSRNPEIADMIGQKPHIILLNKCDVADENATRQWISYYKNSGIPALPVDCRSGKGLDKFAPSVKELLKEKIDRNREKGMVGKALRIMVVGIPNTGKSSFINRMAGSSKAKVADIAGVTRNNQWFAIGNGLELLDTPGVLWPKFDDAVVGDRLAFIGSVKDTVIDTETLALRLLEVMKKDYSDRLSSRYKISDFDNLTALETMELIAKKRGMLISGGDFDYERVSVMLLDEFRAGKLGRITFERPERQ